MYDIILIRFGEIFLKKGNRSFFVSRLQGNLEKKANNLEGIRIGKTHGRFLAFKDDRSPMDPQTAARVVQTLASTFGVVSVSPAKICESTMESILAAGMEVVSAHLETEAADNFRISCSRSSKQVPFNSQEVNRRLGGAVVERFGLPGRMKGADLDVAVEVHAERTFIYTSTVEGPGGLPVGVSGKATLLLSGGIDSPVAGWMMAKRGLALEALYFHSFPYTSEKARKKVEDLAERIAYWHGPMRLHVAPFARVQEYLRDNVPGEYLILTYRRMMIRIACELSRKIGASALVTGESLAQVASQTLENLGVIEDASELTVLRPLVGYDKSETVTISRKLGMFDISIKPYDDCCSLFAPPHPATRAKLERVKKLEQGLELDELVKDAVERIEMITVS